MKNLTDHLVAMEEAHPTSAWALKVGQGVANGTLDGTWNDFFKAARESCAQMRELHGFKRVAAPILTAPDENLKLNKSERPSYGITLQSHVVRTKQAGIFNLCPNAGHCVKVCVLKNGAGAYPSVQRARDWKTELLAKYPTAFFVLLGYELRRAVMKHGRILVRPNVNSDLQWERFAPALVDGSIFGDAITFYGYTKLTNVLDTDGWLTPHYRVAYSWNENSDLDRVNDFLERGGSVAVVSDRKTKQGFRQAQPFDSLKVGPLFDGCLKVANADLTDEWIFETHTIGELAAKGKAERLAGKSGFVVQAYNR